MVSNWTLTQFLAGLVLCLTLHVSAMSCNAQILQKLRDDFGSGKILQYSPEDPLKRSRFFNLQTGHAGAFYNCDGEESKRCSPYICWKTSHGSHWHRTLSDVVRWREDRNEILQRICDGAQGCCDRSCRAATQKSCGGGDVGQTANVGQVEVAESKPTSLPQDHPGTSRRADPFRLVKGKAGLISSTPVTSTPAPSSNVLVTGPGEASELEPDGLSRAGQLNSTRLTNLSAESNSPPKSRSVSLLQRFRQLQRR